MKTAENNTSGYRICTAPPVLLFQVNNIRKIKNESRIFLNFSEIEN